VLESAPGAWVLSRYADVLAVLRDHHRFSNDQWNSPRYRSFQQSLGWTATPIEDARHSILFVDPPDHTRLRKLVSAAFSTRRINEMGPRIRTILGRILDDLDEPSRVDVVQDIAYPLPLRVIAEILGLPAADHDLLREWSTAMGLMIDPVMWLAGHQVDEVSTTLKAFSDYFGRLLEDRRRHPRDDLMSALVNVESDGEVLDQRELVSMGYLLLTAGHETTVNLISNGLYALLNHPDELRRLRRDPSSERLSLAVEEMLRYDSPVQLVVTVATEDFEVDGQRIRGGDEVIAILGSANRDPAQFDDPERFDVSRTGNPHLAFGSGIHFCLGASLARMEARIVFETIFRRWRSFELADEPTRRRSFTLRGFSSLPVSISPAA
jgi:cytochrome P450